MSSTFDTIKSFNMIQTFYADASIVAGANEVYLTSVDVYFKKKPNVLKNVSGKAKPGVTVAICQVRNGAPDLTRCYHTSFIRKSYNQIFSFSDASSPTTFGFTSPVKIPTNRNYGIVLIFEDSGYEVWVNKQGDKLVGTNVTSSGSNLVKDGQVYLYNNSGTFKSLSDTDLKFNLNVAKFNANTMTEVYTNKDYEFFTVDYLSGDFIGGEYVYKLSANATGNVSFTSNTNTVTGTGTNFSGLIPGDKIVLYGNTSTTQVVTVTNVANATSMSTKERIPFSNTSSKYSLTVVGNVFYKDKILNKLYLTRSTANSTYNFSANSTLVGVESKARANVHSVDDYPLSMIKLHADVELPASASLTANVSIASWNGSSYSFSTTNTIKPTMNDIVPTGINSWDARILSRSTEVQNTLYSNTDLLIDNKSVKVEINASVNQSTSNLYVSPYIDRAQVDLYAMQYSTVSNTNVNDANGVSIDTEVLGYGTAKTRHISTKANFANNKFAEDLMLYMTAYRPANTDIKVYARLHNSADSDAFDDKAWTPLTYIENANVYSSSTDKNNYIEYTLSIPQYSDSANSIPGTFTIEPNTAFAVASGSTPSSYVANNDIVKIYDPLIPNNYVVAVASGANSTAITFTNVVSNNNVIGSGLKIDRLKYYNTAFRNISNDNVARYYSTSLVEFDTYDSYQIKIVLNSNSAVVFPKVSSYQAIGVSV